MGNWNVANRQKREGMLEGQQAFLDWLTDPERQGSQADYSKRPGVVSETTLVRWKKDPIFVAAWEDRLRKMNVNPERTQTLVDEVYKLASCAPSVDERGILKAADQLKAIELYLKIVDRMTPTRVITADRSADELTDEELARELMNRGKALMGGVIDVEAIEA